MARFSVDQADHYGSNSGAGFFSLKDHGDKAVIRFMYNTINDIAGDSVHEVEVDGKKRYVNCLRTYNEPVDNCPLCASGNKVIAKFFINIYNADTDAVEVWDRGKSFQSKLSYLCSKHNPLVNTLFEVERRGKKGDTATTYETYPLSTDEIGLEDLPEVTELLGTLILDKTYDDLDEFLVTGYFPAEPYNSRGEEEEEYVEPPVQAANRGRTVPTTGRATPPAGRTAPITRSTPTNAGLPSGVETRTPQGVQRPSPTGRPAPTTGRRMGGSKF